MPGIELCTQASVDEGSTTTPPLLFILPDALTQVKLSQLSKHLFCVVSIATNASK